MSQPQSVEERVWERFVGDTAEHELRIIRDCPDSYRHLRFNKPGTWTYGFDIVTWPGYLCIVGDAGDYVFQRIRDMFEFFESDSGRINPHYWAQKLQAPRDGAEEYSHDTFRQHVLEWGLQQCEDDWRGEMLVYPSLMTEALEREVIKDYTHHHEEARERLDAMADEVGYVDFWEWDLRDYTHQFIWCCYAIVFGIDLYRKATAAKEQT